MKEFPSFAHISMPSILAVLTAATQRFKLFQQDIQIGIMGDSAFGKGNFLMVDTTGTGTEIREKITKGLAEEAITISSDNSHDIMILYHLYDVMSDKHARVLLENFYESEGRGALHTLIFPKSDFLSCIHSMRQCASERQSKQRTVTAAYETA